MLRNMRVLSAVCALLFSLGVALRLGADLFALFLRVMYVPAPPEPEWLAQAVSGLFLAGAVIGLPAQIRLAADGSDSARPWLFAGTGALIAALLIVVAILVVGQHGEVRLLLMAGIRLWLSLGEHIGALPAILLLAGLALTAGRMNASAGALLAAPLVMLSALALTLEVSVTGAALTAMLPMLLCAGALLPAVLVSRRPALAIWPISAASVAAFAAILFPGLFTPGELATLITVPAIVAGAVGYLGASPATRGAWLERAAGEFGGLILALVALNLMGFLITAIPWIVDAKRALAGLSPSIMLALTFLAYIIVAAFTAPLVGVAVVLIMIAAAYGAGVPADILVVGLAVAALQTTVTRGTARQSTQGEAIALPPRQAAWAQMLIMIIVTALAAAAILGWV